MNEHHLLPSNKPGHHWSLCVIRAGKCNIVVTAQEGRAGRSEAIGCTTFEFVMFGDRREQIRMVGWTRLTEKAKREGLAMMHAHLQTKGLLEGAAPPEAPAPLPAERPAVFRLVGNGVEDFNNDNVIEAMAARGYEQQGETGLHGMLRDELKGRPIFNGLCGPMWGGTDPSGLPIVRYETAEVNAQLSA